MKNLIGKVIKVFIPENNVDKMIAFQVLTEERIYEIVTEQTEENSNIYKDDLVSLIIQDISGKEVINICLYKEGDFSD